MTNDISLRFPFLLAWSLLLAACSSGNREVSAARGNPVEQLTGVHTRVVWVQDPSGRDVYARGKKLLLVGYDSADGRGERPLIATPGNYTKPHLSADGNTVVFTDRHQRTIHAIGFDGKGLRTLRKGFAIDCWQDPAGRQYVYFSDALQEDKNAFGFHNVQRFPLDQPDQVEPVFSGGYAHADNFQLSRDGKQAGGLFPWPHGGIADFEKNTWTPVGRGCWSSFSPDNSRLLWIFDGLHRNLYFYDQLNQYEWKVNIGKAPGLDGHETYHPRWSNHTRYFTMTGPYRIRAGVNAIGGGGEVGIYLGKFSEDFQQVENWVQVSRNAAGNFYPDAWIKGGERSDASGALRALAAQRKTVTERKIVLGNRWPGNTEGLVYLWEDSAKDNQVRIDGRVVKCQPRMNGHSFFGSDFQMDLRGGVADFGPEAVKNITAACRKSNELGIELVFHPYGLDAQYGRILSLSQGMLHRNFTIGQYRNQLMAWIRTPDTGLNGADPHVDIAPIEAGRDYHLILSYHQGRVRCWLNGKLVTDSGIVSGDFSNWTGGMGLLSGNETDSRNPWSGRLDGLAVHSRAINADEAAHRYQLYKQKLDARKPLDTVEVEATLLQLGRIPSPASIAPYRRCLVTGMYRIDKVLKGEFPDGSGPGEQFAAAHWAILGEQVLQHGARKPNTKYRMTLSDFEENKQLRGERRAADGLPVEADDLWLWYDGNVN